jgi:hypothetical protein
MTTKYYLFKYSDKNAVDFIDFLYGQTSIKKLLLYTINSFQHIGKGLTLLQENRICFFHISPQNIIFNNDSRVKEHALLNGFRVSLQTNKLNEDYMRDIIRVIKNFTYMPFEIHILYHIFKNPVAIINDDFINEFCSEFVDNMHILRLFSETFKLNYKKLCIDMMRTYIGKDVKYIVNDIIERNSKWDVYGICMIFIHIFGCVINVYALKGTFFNKIIPKLLVNLHPNSSKRLSIEQTIHIFNSQLGEEPDWKFVNNLEKNKLSELFKEFEK